MIRELKNIFIDGNVGSVIGMGLGGAYLIITFAIARQSGGWYFLWLLPAPLFVIGCYYLVKATEK